MNSLSSVKKEIKASFADVFITSGLFHPQYVPISVAIKQNKVDNKMYQSETKIRQKLTKYLMKYKITSVVVR